MDLTTSGAVLKVSDLEDRINDEKGNTNAMFKSNLVDEGLLSLLFGNLRDLDPEFEKYLSTLTSYSLERLSKESDILKQDGAKIRSDMEDLAVKNYKAFIQTSDCVQTIRHEFSSLSVHVHSLIENLPKLNTTCKEFSSKAVDIAQRRAVNRITLQNHTQVIELLEIPQLMDTCVRNGLYDEALELEAFTQKLKKHHPELPTGDVRMSTDMILYQLHEQLRSAIQLPVCLRVIGYLKRLGVYNERELRLSFLQTRGAWLQGVLSAITANNSYNYLTNYTDASRTHMFDIITQYRAIFSDETTGVDDPLDHGALLYSWMNQTITHYIAVLEKHLPLVHEGQNLQYILDQCMYYGTSLGRVGVDFRGLLVPLFERTVMNLFSTSIHNATIYFIDTIRTHKFLHPFDHFSSAPLLETKDQILPPVALLEHPPVAILANNYLNALNELRYCAPYSLQYYLADKLGENLMHIANALANLKKEANRRFHDEETKAFSSVCQVVAEKLIPHVSRSFDLIFHSSKPLVDVTKAIHLLEPLYEKPLTAKHLNESNTQNGVGDHVEDKVHKVEMNGEAPSPIFDGKPETSSVNQQAAHTEEITEANKES